MPSISRIHEKLIDHIIKLRKQNPALFFSPRKINNKGRLEAGYWFLGNEGYVFVNLWNGTDWKEKVNCIGFVVLNNKENYIELSAQAHPELVPFLEKVALIEGGFTKLPHKNKWFKHFADNDYLKSFDYYIHSFKPKVDKLILSENPSIISVITDSEFQKSGQRIIDLRNEQVAFGQDNKITRLSWNTNSWRYPSGWLGKSRSLDTHEGEHGFGFEEWLFDRSKLYDGYHYGFIRGFQSKTGRHVSKVYTVHLYTQNNIGQYFYAGYIQNAEGISKADSVKVFEYYKENGWLKKMESSLKQVEANVSAFTGADPESFFNVRFKIDDIFQKEELEELAELDVNITTDRFKLLPYKGHLVIEMNPQMPEEEDEGNFKNTAKRKRTFNSEQVYDPYHDLMQNAIVLHLRGNPKYGYKHVYIEKSRVDIKAVLPNKEWHYFEIKTDNPKRCIRNAVGQVMEYAYFPNMDRAKKIIVVGDSKPDEDTICYLDYLRKRFDLPLYYRYFDWNLNILSDDF